MLSVEITFPVRHEPASPSAADACDDLMASWYKNGQIETSRWHSTRSAHGIEIIAWIPDAKALDAKYDNIYARQARAALASHGVGAPRLRVLGVDAGFDVACSCGERPSLIMFTNYCSVASPFRCGRCFRPVPLYTLPHTNDEEHLNVLHWTNDYRACDTLQMHCTTGERFAEFQLYRHDSSLSRNGRAIASMLSSRIGIPVYYFIFFSRGTSLSSERERTCPSCDGSWLLERPWHEQFDFRCDACGLVSNVASDLHR